jgi:hypothetical protein
MSGPTGNDPTPEQIALECAAIRAGWSDAERQKRNAERSQRQPREEPLDGMLYDEIGEPLMDIRNIATSHWVTRSDHATRRRARALWKKAQKYGVATAREMAERLERGDVRCRLCLTWFARSSPALAPSMVTPRAVSVECRECGKKRMKNYRKQRKAA